MARPVLTTKHPLDIPEDPRKKGLLTPLYFLSAGYGSQRDYIIENLSILIDSGIGVEETLSIITEDIKNKRLKSAMSLVKQKVDEGFSLWKSFQATKLFPPRIVSLIRVGEESGKLPAYLTLAALEERKEKMFISRIRSALLYPGITLCIAVLVGIGSAWYTLPKILSVITQGGGNLPLTTRVLIVVAQFSRDWGIIAYPIAIALFIFLIYIVFVHKKTKVIGEHIFFHIPGINDLVRGIEEVRFGFILGSSLQAGVPIVQALRLLSESTTLVLYRRLYTKMADEVEKGTSFYNALLSFPNSKRYLSSHFQHMIRAAEQSGKLSDTLLKIGVIMEEKTTVQSRDFSTVIEPIVLVIVAVVVGFIALGIISPIYSITNLSF
jgi:type II secretory pathway component PulF